MSEIDPEFYRADDDWGGEGAGGRGVVELLKFGQYIDINTQFR